ncbi:hypothetical protein ACE01N_01125 [Saccharicrinis sp. FJH2]|uniref:hypothetical protein n=1 Tax=Saccharicrinis sp. FJH65 TaxID=3344659 RepID=UPI0035F4A30C
MKKNIIIAIIISATGLSASAQTDTTINKNVVVVREYNPTISDANKINLIPEIQKPEIKTPTFSYSFFTHPLETSFEIIPLTPATLSSEPRRDYDQNYISLGGGNYSSLFGELFYNAFHSDKHSLSFFANNRSSFGKVKMEDGSKNDATFVKNNLLLAYKHQFWGTYLTANLGFSNHNYRYFGYQTIKPDSVSYMALNDTNNVVLNQADITYPNQKPGYASFKANFVFATNPSIYDETAYKAELYYDHFFTRMDFKEDLIGLKGFFEKPVGDNLAGGALDVQYGMYNVPDTALYKDFNNFTYIDFSPYFKLNRNTWNLKLGLNAFFNIQKDKTDYLVTPDIDFNFNLIEKLFTAHLMAGGNYRLNDYRNSIQINPYMTPELNVMPTQIPLSLEAGLTGQLTPKIVFNGSVNFSIVKNNPFYINEFYITDTSQVSSVAYSNQFTAVYDDMNVLTVKAAIDYAGNDRYSFGASGAYYNYALDNLEYAWHLPDYEIKVYGSFVPYRNVTVNVDFTTISKREALTQDAIGSGVTERTQLKAVYDLSLSGEYQYNNRLSASLNLNNILSSNYYYWNGYPSFGFNVLAGVKYRF